MSRTGIIIGALLFAAPALLAVASEPTTAADAATHPANGTTAVRGLANALELRVSGLAIRATANQSPTSPILVRATPSGPRAGDTQTYRVEFIGMVAGDYDLSAYLERQDGSPLDVGPLPVRVVSQLPPGYGTDLFSSAQAPALGRRWYLTTMLALTGAWLSVPVVYVVVRIMRRRAVPPPAPVAPPPTLADQLRPLAEAAISGALSIAQRGRLELLMYMYWRERLGLDGPPAQIVAQLRREPQAGGLLRAMEAWLHAARRPVGQAQGELAALLEPYRCAPAIALDDRTVAAQAEGGS